MPMETGGTGSYLGLKKGKAIHKKVHVVGAFQASEGGEAETRGEM